MITTATLVARHNELTANGRPFGKATDFVATLYQVPTLTVVRAVVRDRVARGLTPAPTI